MIEINVIGGGWVTAGSFGRMRRSGPPVLTGGIPVIPPADELFSRPPARYRRFDTFTRLGFAAISLALKDSGLAGARHRRPIGIVVSSVYECAEVDYAFYETAREEGGRFASPNLFSYTLPGIVTGEAAIHFKLSGPSFTVGDSPANRGYPALSVSADIISSRTCDTMVAGWLDSSSDLPEDRGRGEDPVRGAIFLVLSSGHLNCALTGIRKQGPGLIRADGGRIHSIVDVFG